MEKKSGLSPPLVARQISVKNLCSNQVGKLQACNRSEIVKKFIALSATFKFSSFLAKTVYTDRTYLGLGNTQAYPEK